MLLLLMLLLMFLLMLPFLLLLLLLTLLLLVLLVLTFLQAVGIARAYSDESDLLLRVNPRRPTAPPKLFAPRLGVTAAAASNAGELTLEKGVYIVSGGTGGVGGAVVDWLIDVRC